MNSQASAFGHGAHHGNHRPLAIGAGNMNGRWQLVVWVAEALQKRKCALQAKINQLWMEFCKPVKRGGGAGGAVRNAGVCHQAALFVSRFSIRKPSTRPRKDGWSERGTTLSTMP